MATSTCPLANSQRYLMLADESVAWGTAGATWYHLPVFRYGVKFTPTRRQARPKVGLMQGKHNSLTKGMVSGQLDTALYGYGAGTSDTVSLMEKMLSWAFGDSESVCTSSKSAEWGIAGTDYGNKQHLGLRVDSAVLRGSEDQDYIGLTLNLKGKNESNSTFTMETLPTDMNGLTECEFSNVDFYIGPDDSNLVLLPIRAFALQRNRGQMEHYLGSTRPTYIGATVSVTNLTVVPLKLDNTNDAYLRTVGSTAKYGRLVIKGSHEGSLAADSLAVATLDFPLLSFADKDDNDDSDGHTFEPLSWAVLKPDTSESSVEMAFTTE